MALLATGHIPFTVAEALSGPDADEWQRAVDKEMTGIEAFGTYTLHDRSEMPAHIKPVQSRIVLDVKLDPTGGNSHRAKARFVAKGFTQKYGIDFYETFCPTGHRQSFRQFCVIVAVYDLEVKNYDVSQAFLHGRLNEVVWLVFPLEVATGHRRGKVALLHRSLYGLKQAGKCWNETFDEWLRKMGFVPTDADACVYILKDDKSNIKLALYLHVDDAAIAGATTSDIDAFAVLLNAEFPCRDQGELKYFLGMEIERDRPNKLIYVTQHQYSKRVLDKFAMTDCNPRNIPISPGCILRKPSPEDHAAATHLPYRELTGSLQYLSTMTRPDLAYAVNKLSQYNDCYSEELFKVARGLLRYLQGTINHGLCLGLRSEQHLQACVDSDHQGCRDTRRSTTGWVVQFSGSTIAWKSKRQNIVSHSTAESELIALDHCVRDVQWERRGIQALTNVSLPGPTIVHVDNRSAIDLAKNNSSHDSTKHIDARYFYVRELIKAEQVSILHIAGIDNPADIFTKALPFDSFSKHRSTLGISAYA